QLNRLRELFDDPLLIPARRGMTPTVKALELIGPLRESLDQIRSTLQSHKDFKPERGILTINIACTDYIQATVVIPLVLALRTKAPAVRIAVHHYNPAHLERELASGKIDMAIVSKGTHVANLRMHRLFNETYGLIARQKHSFFQKELSMEKFVEFEHVIVSPSGGLFATPIDDVLKSFGLKRKVVMSAASFLFVPQIISASDLLALVPWRLAQGLSDEYSKAQLPWLKESFDVSLIWHERSQGHAGQKWVRDLIVELNGERETER
ncbi:MAG: LysR family transcriptional regulator, partial [Proteobacteria bacterium]